MHLLPDGNGGHELDLTREGGHSKRRILHSRDVTGREIERALLAAVAAEKNIVVLDGLGVRDDGPGAPHTKGPALLFTASPLLDDGAFVREDCSGGCSFGWNSAASRGRCLR